MAKKATEMALATSIHKKLLARAAANGRKVMLSQSDQKAYLNWYKPKTMAENELLHIFSNLPLYSNAELVERMVLQLQIENLNAHKVTIKPLNATGASKTMSLILFAKVGVNFDECLHDFKKCFNSDGELKEDVRQFTTTREVERWIATVSKLLATGICLKLTLCEQLSGQYIFYVFYTVPTMPILEATCPVCTTAAITVAAGYMCQMFCSIN